MNDTNCPYCEAGIEINHDDGYGYEEDCLHQQECPECDKLFAYSTMIHFYYDAQKADCLNGGEHYYKMSRTHPKEYTMYICTNCGDIRAPTEQEMKRIIMRY